MSDKENQVAKAPATDKKPAAKKTTAKKTEEKAEEPKAE